MPNINLTWDPMPAGETWTEVRIYENGTKIGSVLMPATTISLSVVKAVHTFTARSFDASQPVDWQESLDSNPFTVKVPSPPNKLGRA